MNELHVVVCCSEVDTNKDGILQFDEFCALLRKVWIVP